MTKKNKKCIVCGETTGATYCMRCRASGERNGHWKGGKTAKIQRYVESQKHPCLDCGVMVTRNSKRCMSCAHKNVINRNPIQRRVTTPGYILIRKHGHPRANELGWVREHVYVWEEHNGRPLPDSWVVHHLNGIKGDNRPKNLTALPRNKHNAILAVMAKRIQELEALLNNQNQLL